MAKGFFVQLRLLGDRSDRGPLRGVGTHKIWTQLNRENIKAGTCVCLSWLHSPVIRSLHQNGGWFTTSSRPWSWRASVGSERDVCQPTTRDPKALSIMEQVLSFRVRRHRSRAIRRGHQVVTRPMGADLVWVLRILRCMGALSRQLSLSVNATLDLGLHLDHVRRREIVPGARSGGGRACALDLEWAADSYPLGVSSP